jgi:hypothetical protein
MKKIYPLIIIIVLVLGFVFYWYQYRPMKIKQRCASDAHFDSRATSEPDDRKRQEFIDSHYDDCIMIFGLK